MRARRAPSAPRLRIGEAAAVVVICAALSVGALTLIAGTGGRRLGGAAPDRATCLRPPSDRRHADPGGEDSDYNDDDDNDGQAPHVALRRPLPDRHDDHSPDRPFTADRPGATVVSHDSPLSESPPLRTRARAIPAHRLRPRLLRSPRPRTPSCSTRGRTPGTLSLRPSSRLRTPTIPAAPTSTTCRTSRAT